MKHPRKTATQKIVNFTNIILIGDDIEILPTIKSLLVHLNYVTAFFIWSRLILSALTLSSSVVVKVAWRYRGKQPCLLTQHLDGTGKRCIYYSLLAVIQQAGVLIANCRRIRLENYQAIWSAFRTQQIYKGIEQTIVQALKKSIAGFSIVQDTKSIRSPTCERGSSSIALVRNLEPTDFA